MNGIQELGFEVGSELPLAVSWELALSEGMQSPGLCCLATLGPHRKRFE